MPATDPLAHERFRTIITEALHENGIDEGTENVAHVIAPEFPRSHFEREINGAGVAMRRVVAVGVWEVDPVQPITPDVRCQECGGFNHHPCPYVDPSRPV